MKPMDFFAQHDTCFPISSRITCDTFPSSIISCARACLCLSSIRSGLF
jgi:hypothetical protein